jgi:hypothetical protein
MSMSAVARPAGTEAWRAGKSGRRKLDLVNRDGDGAWQENTASQKQPVFTLRGDLGDRMLSDHNPHPAACICASSFWASGTRNV